MWKVWRGEKSLTPAGNRTPASSVFQPVLLNVCDVRTKAKPAHKICKKGHGVHINDLYHVLLTYPVIKYVLEMVNNSQTVHLRGQHVTEILLEILVQQLPIFCTR